MQKSALASGPSIINSVYLHVQRDCCLARAFNKSIYTPYLAATHASRSRAGHKRDMYLEVRGFLHETGWRVFESRETMVSENGIWKRSFAVKS